MNRYFYCFFNRCLLSFVTDCLMSPTTSICINKDVCWFYLSPSQTWIYLYIRYSYFITLMFNDICEILKMLKIFSFLFYEIANVFLQTMLKFCMKQNIRLLTLTYLKRLQAISLKHHFWRFWPRRSHENYLIENKVLINWLFITACQPV